MEDEEETWLEESLEESLSENEEMLDPSYFSENFYFRTELDDDPSNKVIWHPIFHS